MINMNQSLGARPYRLAISSVIGVVLLVCACPSTRAQPASPSYDNPRDGLRKRAEDCNNGTATKRCFDMVKDEYVILKDTKNNSYLLIPVPAISGIEANTSGNPLPNYWEAAWNWAAGKSGKLKGQVIGLAINSANVRSQDQLHIHIACLEPKDITKLQSQGITTGLPWQTQKVDFQLSPNNGTYDVIRVSDLSTTSPFEWLLKNSHIVSSSWDNHMADQTVVVTQIPGGIFIFSLGRLAPARNCSLTASEVGSLSMDH